MAVRSSMSDADLMSAVRSARQDSASGLGKSRSASEANLKKSSRSRGSSGRGSATRSAGSQISSSPGGRKRPPVVMTFEEMQEHVFNLSMNKYIKDLEKEAKEAAIENKWTAQKIKDGMQQEIDEKVRARQLAQENQVLVKRQIEENKNRRADTRRSFVEAASAHNFPLFTETFISQDEVEEYRKNLKVQFRAELDHQAKTTKVLRNMLVKQDKEYAAKKLADNLTNMAKDHEKDHQTKRDKSQEMMRVWDRDIRLKNIKLAILSGKDASEMTG